MSDPNGALLFDGAGICTRKSSGKARTTSNIAQKDDLGMNDPAGAAIGSEPRRADPGRPKADHGCGVSLSRFGIEGERSHESALGLAQRRPKLTEAQIAFVLQEAEAGVPVADFCRRAGITDATYYNWRRRYGGLLASEYAQLRQLKHENDQLRRMLEELVAQSAPKRRPRRAYSRQERPSFAGRQR